MTTSIEKLNKEKQELEARADATLDAVKDSEDAEEIRTAHNTFDDLIDKADLIGEQIKRHEKIEKAQNERLAAEEARQQVEPRDAPADGNVIESRDGAPSMDERNRRTDIIQRHYLKGEKVSEDELILANKRYPEERVFFKVLKRGRDNLTSDEKKLLRYVNKDGAATRAFPVDTSKTGSDPGGVVGTDAEGGYLVPEQFQARVIETMKDYSGLLDAGVVNMITTPTGATMSFPSNDDTANKGAIVNEGGFAGWSEMSFGEIQIGAHKYTTRGFPMSSELLQDAEINIETFLRDAMAKRLARILEEHLTVGTGSGQPEGLVKKLEGVSGRQTSVAAAKWTTHEVYNILLDLEHQVDKAYRNSGMRWMLHDQFLKALRKVKDADNQYIWERSVKEGEPSMLLGRPYFTNAHMTTALTANNYPILIGDFSNFLVRTTRTLNIRRLDEMGAMTDSTIFVGFARYDSKVMDEDAFALGKVTT